MCVCYVFEKVPVIQWSEFLVTDPEFPGLIPRATKISEKPCIRNGVHSASC
jgi:hypothetical protein